MVNPIIYRVSTIRLVMQDFATIHSMYIYIHNYIYIYTMIIYYKNIYTNIYIYTQLYIHYLIIYDTIKNKTKKSPTSPSLIVESHYFSQASHFPQVKSIPIISPSYPDKHMSVQIIIIHQP